MKPSTAALSIGPSAPSDVFHSGPRERLIRILTVGAGLSIALGLIIVLGGHGHLHWPNFGLLRGRPPVLFVHIGAALTALLIGVGLMWGPKGTTIHRTFGWTWVVAMMTVAISSFFIRDVIRDGFSPIHAISAYVAIGIPMGVAFARRHDIRAHRRMMTGNFLFGLIVAGAFTFVPGRLMWAIFFG